MTPMCKDFQENDSELSIEIVMPGYDKEDFNLSIEENRLLLTINRKEKESIKYVIANYYIDRTYDLENTTAKYKNGILKVVVPKTRLPKLKKAIEVS